MRNTEEMRTETCDSSTSLLICQVLGSLRRWTSGHACEEVSGFGWRLTVGGIIPRAGVENWIEKAKEAENQHALFSASWL